MAYWKWITVAIGILLLLDVASYFVAEGLWFQDLNYVGVFRVRVFAQITLGALAFLGSFGFTTSNLSLAQRLPAQKLDPHRQGLKLRSLLFLALVLSLVIAVLVLYHGQVAANYWQPRVSLNNQAYPLPIWAKPASAWQLIQYLMTHRWQSVALLGSAVALTIYPRPLVAIASLLLSLAFSLVLSEQWLRVLPALTPVLFNQKDSLFQRDISFYIFALPVWELLEFWLTGLLFFTVVAVMLVYLLSNDSLSQGRFPGFSPPQQRHLYGLGGGLLIATSLSHWLSRYQLLFSNRGAIHGANFTDVAVVLPVNGCLSLTALLLGLALLWRTLFWSVSFRSVWDWLLEIGTRKYAYIPPMSRRPLGSQALLGGLEIYLFLAVLGVVVAPYMVQQLIVQPNELVRETPYIEEAIKQTRQAFDLTNIEVEEFSPEGTLTAADLQRNYLTIDNVRLWDTRPLLESNRQLQQIRLYYEFIDADVDRYTISDDAGTASRRQVLISARELNYERVPPEAKTWVNEHLVYTHGYGFTISPVNTAGPDGLPAYFIQDIGHLASSEAVRRSFPVGQPRIYFGELTNTHIMTNTKVQELDYPSGNDNIYTTYAGRGGINVGSFWRRVLFAKHLADWQMLFTEDFTPESRLLFRRNIKDRVLAIAPFLQFDSDPYLVVADIKTDPSQWGMQSSLPPPQTADETSSDNTPNNTLYWVLDAYTTSDHYPYSDPGTNNFNYIRNSVKVVVDAFNGTVQFYMADDRDPIIHAWNRIFAGMFQPLDSMPMALRSHLRFPQDLYQVESNQLMTYHMTDPRVFYNREDQWRAPNEIYANEAKLVEPYYLIMKLPQASSEEFILLQPFTPSQRNNLVGWLAARSDDEQYGRRLLYRFPKQKLVFGPEQVEARINQDPEISQRISLWNTQGSRAKQGNLLVIPVERSLLYVEPLYLEAEQNRLPILARVIVVYQNRIAMAETMNQALAAIFSGQREQAPTILRDLDDANGNAPSLESDLIPGLPQTPASTP